MKKIIIISVVYIVFVLFFKGYIPFFPTIPIYPNNNEEISLELYEKIMKDLASHKWQGGIVFSAFGEPMLHKNVLGLIKLTKKYLPDSILDIVTNGDQLKPKKVKSLFKAGLDVLKVSLYDGPEQIEIFDNMRKKIGVGKNKFILRHRYDKDENFLIGTN